MLHWLLQQPHPAQHSKKVEQIALWWERLYSHWYFVYSLLCILFGRFVRFWAILRHQTIPAGIRII